MRKHGKVSEKERERKREREKENTSLINDEFSIDLTIEN